MNRYVRRAVIGAITGCVASIALIATQGHAGWVLLLGATLGAGFALGTGPTPGAYLDNMMTAGAYGVPLWGILSVIAFPLLSGKCRSGAPSRRAHFPALVGRVLFGAAIRQSHG